MSLCWRSQRGGPFAQVLCPRGSECARPERLPRLLNRWSRHLLHELPVHRVRQAVDQRRHPHHLLRARVSRRQRPAGPLSEPGGDPNASDPLVTNSAPSVDAGKGVAATTGSASTTKEMLIFGCGCGIGTEAAGKRTAQANSTSPQPRHPAPHTPVTAPRLSANLPSPPCANDAMPALQVMTS